ncbi:MAG: hypothetical protein IPK16_28565 [Anaerolineales bacterium]|nr:hypothetical protein [Anaerolineales bacterium]
MPVLGLAGGAAVTVGLGHSCALLTNGTAACWGDNTFGQLGDGTTVSRQAPAPVAGLTNIIALAAGYQHTCALLQGGSVRCWGYNETQQLGDNTNVNRSLPTQVVGLTGGVAAIAGGGAHTCALLITGSIVCWGDNSRQTW